MCVRHIASFKNNYRGIPITKLFNTPQKNDNDGETPDRRPAAADVATPRPREGAEKGIIFYALENRLFEELFKFLQACPNFRFSRGYYQKNGAYRPYFPFILSSIRFILTRFDANILSVRYLYIHILPYDYILCIYAHRR